MEKDHATNFAKDVAKASMPLVSSKCKRRRSSKTMGMKSFKLSVVVGVGGMDIDVDRMRFSSRTFALPVLAPLREGHPLAFALSDGGSTVYHEHCVRSVLVNKMI